MYKIRIILISGLNCGFFFLRRREEENKPNLVSDGTIKASLGFLERLNAVRYADTLCFIFIRTLFTRTSRLRLTKILRTY